MEDIKLLFEDPSCDYKFLSEVVYDMTNYTYQPAVCRTNLIKNDFWLFTTSHYPFTFHRVLELIEGTPEDLREKLFGDIKLISKFIGGMPIRAGVIPYGEFLLYGECMFDSLGLFKFNPSAFTIATDIKELDGLELDRLKLKYYPEYIERFKGEKYYTLQHPFATIHLSKMAQAISQYLLSTDSLNQESIKTVISNYCYDFNGSLEKIVEVSDEPNRLKELLNNLGYTI